MRTLPRILFVFGVLLFGNACPTQYAPRDGDIIFQTSLSSQSAAVQKATKSPYSHMGIVYVNGGRPMVYEAVGPVKLTRFKEWTARGKDNRYVVKRLKDADRRLTTGTLKRMRDAGKQFDGKPYDPYFEWSDKRVYCSELVWKIYERGAGIELCRLQRMGDFDLSDRTVRAKIDERFGGNAPLDENVIAPAAIFDSPLLATVFSNEPKPDQPRKKNTPHR